jgi:hypothetical protein
VLPLIKVLGLSLTLFRPEEIEMLPPERCNSLESIKCHLRIGSEMGMIPVYVKEHLGLVDVFADDGDLSIKLVTCLL